MAPIFIRHSKLARGISELAHSCSIVAGTLIFAAVGVPTARSSVETVDSSFNPAGPVTGAAEIRTIAPLPNGDLLVGGVFSTWEKQVCNGLVCLRSDGSVRIRYQLMVGTFPGQANRILVDNQGRSYVCGGFDSINGMPRPWVCRLLANGDVDAGFIPEFGPADAINDIALSQDGTALWAAGASTSAPPRTPLIKLSTADGRRIPGVAAPVLARPDEFVPEIRSIAAMPDGGVFAGGEFQSVNNHPAPNIARFDANGQFIGTWAGGNIVHVNTVALLRPKHLLLANRTYGTGSNFDYLPLLRLNVDGSREEPVNYRSVPSVSGTPIYPDLYIPLIDPDGRFYAVGAVLTTLSSATFPPQSEIQANIARLFPDGSLDPSFAPQVNGMVETVARDAAGRLLVGGSITSIDGVSVPGLARLLMDGDRPLIREAAARTIESIEGKVVRLDSTVYGQEGDLIWSKDGREITRTSGSELVFIDASPNVSGSYTFVATNAHGSTTSQPIQLTVHPIAPGFIDPDFPSTASANHRFWAYLPNRSQWVSYDGTTLTYYTEDLVPLDSHTVSDPESVIQSTGIVPIQNGNFILLGLGWKLDATGTRDKQFHLDAGYLQNVLPAGDSGLWAVVSDADLHLVRVFANGSVDASFKTIDRVGPMALAPDGKLVVYRPMNVSSDHPVPLERFSADGSLDTTFAPPQAAAMYGIGANTSLSLGELLVAPDGTVIFSSHDPFTGTHLWWLTNNGQVLRQTVAANPANETCRLVAAPDAGTVFTMSDSNGFRWIGSDGIFHPCQPLPDPTHPYIDKAYITSRGLVVRPWSGQDSVRRYTTRTSLGQPLLINLSGLGFTGEGDNTLVAGFFTAGSGTQDLLIRAIGPGLNPFGVSNVASDPILDLFQDSTTLQTVDNWGAEDVGGKLSQAFRDYGAFALTSGSTDAALVRTMSQGTYTVQVRSGAGTPGMALTEIYGGRSSLQKLQNISLRGSVDGGARVLSAGFVLGGNTTSRVLIRVVGPGLRSFGLTSALPDPVLSVYSQGELLATNDDWIDGGQQPLIEAANQQFGAFPLVASSLDSALLLDLEPGAYTAVATSKDGSAGAALVEIYWLDSGTH